MRLTEVLPRETGRDYALRTLKDNIIRLELVPGSMVSENELAAALHLSRTPVREALIELSKSKIVEIYPQRGSKVSLVDYALVEESQFIRKVLECAVVELCCQKATPGDLKSLEETIILQKLYTEHYDADALLSLDNQFHRILFEIVQKPQAYALMSGVAIHFDRVRNMALLTAQGESVIEDHREILSLISKRDAAGARARMEVHLSRYRVDEALIRQKYPAYFKP
ncbi:MAG: GntR family transcriptional regulator [Oscillospiraceae bacterium]